MMTSETNYLDLFVEYLRVERQYSAETIKAYRSDIRQVIDFIKIEDEKKNILLMDQLDVRIYLAQRYEAEDSPRTIARKVSSLRAFFQFMIRNDLAKENPFADVQLKKGGQHLPRHFYEQELKRLFEYVKEGDGPLEIRNRLILETLYGVGLRVSELANLKISDVDRRNKIITVLGKGNKTRTLPFGDYLADAFSEYLTVARPILVAKAEQDSGFIFLNQRGNNISASGVEYILKQLAKAAGISQNVTAHMFRHTFATDLLNHGADLRSVQSLLGHSNLSTTQIYTHVTTQDLQKSYRNFFPRA